MTREQLEQRKAELVASLEQQKANLHATDGAIQECVYWLAQLEVEAVKPEETLKPKGATK
jgi:hypothetical protein